jgi:tungstate transport system substrate-binding protein
VRRCLSLAALAVLALGAACRHEARHVRLGTTTSVQDSGLLDDLVPAFEQTAGLHVDVIAVGTGAAFRLARDGNVDLLLVHDREGEEEFLAAGEGVARRSLMWNTFELLGPAEDPAGVRAARSAPDALARIARAGAVFVSRGDDSGTHRLERRLWRDAGGPPAWPGYRETGQGMGATLRVADELGAYVLTDRGTRLGYQQGLRLVPMLADRPELRNEYSVVLISPAKHPDLNHEGARRLGDWLLSPDATRLVEAFRVNGQPLFHAMNTRSP